MVLVKIQVRIYPGKLCLCAKINVGWKYQSVILKTASELAESRMEKVGLYLLLSQFKSPDKQFCKTEKLKGTSVKLLRREKDTYGKDNSWYYGRQFRVKINGVKSVVKCFEDIDGF
nr:unnamed protein product [Callosobruchus analis]